MTKTTRQALAEMRADRKKRRCREARDAELDRQDREAAHKLANIKPPLCSPRLPRASRTISSISDGKLCFPPS